MHKEVKRVFYLKLIYMNWPVLIIIGVICIALVVFTIVRNMKDEEEFEEQAHNDYPKPKHEHADTDPEETPK